MASVDPEVTALYTHECLLLLILNSSKRVRAIVRVAIKMGKRKQSSLLSFDFIKKICLRGEMIVEHTNKKSCSIFSLLN